MFKHLAACFGFVLALILVAAVMNVTAQPDANVLQVQFTQEAEQRLQQIEGDIDFLVRAMTKAGLIEQRQ